jgi:hypothetical protein
MNLYVLSFKSNQISLSLRAACSLTAKQSNRCHCEPLALQRRSKQIFVIASRSLFSGEAIPRYIHEIASRQTTPLAMTPFLMT